MLVSFGKEGVGTYFNDSTKLPLFKELVKRHKYATAQVTIDDPFNTNVHICVYLADFSNPDFVEVSETYDKIYDDLVDVVLSLSDDWKHVGVNASYETFEPDEELFGIVRYSLIVFSPVSVNMPLFHDRAYRMVQEYREHVDGVASN